MKVNRSKTRKDCMESCQCAIIDMILRRSLKCGGFNKYKCSESFYSLWDTTEHLIVSSFFFTSVPHLDIGTTLSSLMRSLYLKIYFFKTMRQNEPFRKGRVDGFGFIFCWPKRALIAISNSRFFFTFSILNLATFYLLC